MTKREVLKYCEEKAEEGYLTHTLLLEIFDDHEDIPDDIVDLICHKPQRNEPTILSMGEQGIQIFNQAVEDYFLTLVHGEILDKYRNNNIRS